MRKDSPVTQFPMALDGFTFRNREATVVGGVDTAVSDARELSQHAGKVHFIHRPDHLQAVKVLQQLA